MTANVGWRIDGDQHRLRPLRGRMPAWWTNATCCDPFRVGSCFWVHANKLRPLRGRMPTWWINATCCDPFRVGSCFWANKLRHLRGRMPTWWINATYCDPFRVERSAQPVPVIHDPEGVTACNPQEKKGRTTPKGSQPVFLTAGISDRIPHPRRSACRSAPHGTLSSRGVPLVRRCMP